VYSCQVPLFTLLNIKTGPPFSRPSEQISSDVIVKTNLELKPLSVALLADLNCITMYCICLNYYNLWRGSIFISVWSLLNCLGKKRGEKPVTHITHNAINWHKLSCQSSNLCQNLSIFLKTAWL